jgi:hypothetical protein
MDWARDHREWHLRQMASVSVPIFSRREKGTDADCLEK